MIVAIVLIILTLVMSVVFVRCREITFWEFLATVVCLVFATWSVQGLSQITEIHNSYYFKSGRIMWTSHYPSFVERYIQVHVTCSGSGENQTCRTYSTTEKVRHPEYWTVRDSLDREWEVSKSFYLRVRSDFGNPTPIVDRSSRLWHGGTAISGDPKSYKFYNKSNTYEYPVSERHSWHNPLINSASLFNMRTRDKKKIQAYPNTDGKFFNNRLIHRSGDITAHDWDVFNTKLYEKNKANSILVQVDEFSKCNEIKSDWVSGGQNDLAICIHGPYSKPNNVLVFGWSSNYLGMNRMEEFILNRGLTKNTLSDFLSVAQDAYYPTDFSRFDYLRGKHTFWFYLILIIVLCLVGGYCFSEFYSNDHRK